MVRYKFEHLWHHKAINDGHLSRHINDLQNTSVYETISLQTRRLKPTIVGKINRLGEKLKNKGKIVSAQFIKR